VASQLEFEVGWLPGLRGEGGRLVGQHEFQCEARNYAQACCGRKAGRSGEKIAGCSWPGDQAVGSAAKSVSN